MKADLSKLRPKHRFGTILADPPWPLTGGKGGRDGWSRSQSADWHYPIMTFTHIAAMGSEVQRLAAPDSHLYLWTVNNFVPQAIDVMEEWGFRYVTMITWLKTSGAGLGQYFVGRTEHCLFGVRGKPGYAPGRPKGMTGFEADGAGFKHPRLGHSVKPPTVHEWAELVSPGPRLELFARAERKGWTTWGGKATTYEERRSA